MSEQANLTLMRRFFDEIVNGGDLDLIDELIAPDVIEHEAFPGLEPNREGIKQFLGLFRRAFPDLHFEVRDLLAEGDRVAARVRITGTHRGEFNGIPPTGRRIDVAALDICRIEGGRLAEHWGNTDTLGMLQQLGVIPTSEAEPESAALVRTFYDAYNTRSYDTAAALVTPNARFIDVPTGQELTGPAGTRTMMEGWATAFPDSTVEIQNLIAAPDQVVVEFVGRGTHGGPLETPEGAIHATGRPVEIRFVDVWQVRDGKIAANRTYYDLASMMAQLGLTAEPQAEAASSAGRSPLYDSFDAAWNAHDLERVMAHFTDDAVVRMIPPMPDAPEAFHGKSEIRQFVADMLPGFRVQSANIKEEGERLTWLATVSNDAFRQLGVASMQANCVALVRGGKVHAFTPTFTEESVARLQAAQAAGASA